MIAATSTPAGLPAKAATTTIPIVFVTGSDPIEQGLVKSLNRPEGNITGITTLAVELGQKRMELMREVVPTATLIGVLINSKGPNVEVYPETFRAQPEPLGYQSMCFMRAPRASWRPRSRSFRRCEQAPSSSAPILSITRRAERSPR